MAMNYFENGHSPADVEAQLAKVYLSLRRIQEDILTATPSSEFPHAESMLTATEKVIGAARRSPDTDWIGDVFGRMGIVISALESNPQAKPSHILRTVEFATFTDGQWQIPALRELLDIIDRQSPSYSPTALEILRLYMVYFSRLAADPQTCGTTEQIAELLSYALNLVPSSRGIFAHDVVVLSAAYTRVQTLGERIQGLRGGSGQMILLQELYGDALPAYDRAAARVNQYILPGEAIDDMPTQHLPVHSLDFLK